MSDKITIRKGSIEEAVSLSQQVPEFFQPYSEKIYEERLRGKPHLILIAEIEGVAVGFKVGYQKDDQEIFYSWMGGVLATHRRKGIATLLANEQETWAYLQGYKKVQFKTRNYLTKMIHFGLNRGFMIKELFKRDKIENYRILMEKDLKP
ncbi:GNAT family N-acetyltransferase [Pararhodonellum marinum]|uniref:GNAT family N-acetyltransferase n=1 Tax=Pararhodonellum marinum TaxID=2755358 RepID=UPI0018901B19|nr:GNAT family N-acetyltransferase [Pararhodonellum marinum]